jgi:hypothetical protein
VAGEGGVTVGVDADWVAGGEDDVGGGADDVRAVGEVDEWPEPPQATQISEAQATAAERSAKLDFRGRPPTAQSLADPRQAGRH